MNKIQITQVIGLFGLVILTIVGIHLYRDTMLQNTDETFAVFVEPNVGVGITQKKFKFQTRSGELVEASVVYKESIDVGDTVWIEYSIENPSVIKVLDLNYKKYRSSFRKRAK